MICMIHPDSAESTAFLIRFFSIVRSNRSKRNASALCHSARILRRSKFCAVRSMIHQMTRHAKKLPRPPSDPATMAVLVHFCSEMLLKQPCTDRFEQVCPFPRTHMMHCRENLSTIQKHTVPIQPGELDPGTLCQHVLTESRPGLVHPPWHSHARVPLSRLPVQWPACMRP